MQTRRRFFKWLQNIFLASLAGLGFYSATRFLPRPPKKILVKERLKPGQILVKGAFFLEMTKEGPVALSRRCPHLGCLVTYVAEEGHFVCPCHQSRFDLTGRYLSGPAKKDLARLPVQKTEGGLIVEVPA